MNSFDLMIERYSKELIETGKKSIMSAVEEVIEEENSEVVNAKEGYEVKEGSATIEGKNIKIKVSKKQIRGVGGLKFRLLLLTAFILSLRQM